MNIDDVGEIKVPKKCLITEIFKRQSALRARYVPIEIANGFRVPVPPFQIDDRFVQACIKDLFWRATEEISEALENLIIDGYQLPQDWQLKWNQTSQVRHFFEELADALHFIVEVSIVGQFSPLKVTKTHWIWLREEQAITDKDRLSSKLPKAIHTDELIKICGKTIFMMGLAANMLKNKPWKVSHVITDSTKFSNQMSVIWHSFGTLWAYLGTDIKFIYLLYMKKNLVNQFRQRSKY